MMENDISGVRISPPVVEFYDCEVKEVYRINISVKNVSKSSKNIRFYDPKTKLFRLKVKNPEKAVAPGLEVQALVEYEPDGEREHKDRLVLTVDGDVIEIPLLGYPVQPILEIEGPVNFGNVVANSKVIAQEISVVNKGSKQGEFKIKYGGDKPIAIIPSSGAIPPKSAQIIKIEYVTKQPGSFDEHAKVRLEGQETQILQIKGNVVERVLELQSTVTGDPIECLKFGSAYYGTDRTESAILFNNGPEPVNFVAILDEDTTGQETGLDLTKSTRATIAEMNDVETQQSGKTNPLTSLVTAIPNQGTLGPYEKIPIFFRFSPRWNSIKQGYKCKKKPPPRQDFALFMKIQMIGASQGFQNGGDQQEKSNVEGSHCEIALTGTALPVLLSISPQSKFDFEECPVGEHVDALCCLLNESNTLPVTYQFRRLAHFSAKPSNGKILPGNSTEIIVSFTPHQAGSFKRQLQLDVIGQVADNRNPFLAHLEVIHTLPITLMGKSDPLTVIREPKFNPGITPKVVGEVGQFVETKLGEADSHKLRGALQLSKGTKLHKTSKSQGDVDVQAYVAFPNDRATSIRPSERHKEYKTIFTHTDRYNFVDPDYAYTDEEMEAVKSHKKHYVEYIKTMRENRIKNRKNEEFNEANNKTNIGIKSAQGLKPKKLTQDEIVPDPRSPTPPNQNWRVLSTKELAQNEFNITQQRVKEGLNAVPTTPKEKEDCSQWLSPQMLHQVIIGPPTIEFGEVCLRSTSTKELNIVNNLNQYIHVEVQIDCRELRQTSPLSQVVPPCSRARLPLIFESNSKGKFQRSVDYVINGFYKHHVIVVADVVPVALHINKDELLVTPGLGLPAEAGFRSVVTLTNKLNYPAEFTWQPILGDIGTAFSVRPATGIVDAFTDLDCEIVFHPSYIAPAEGHFALQVHGGSTKHLKCMARFGPTTVQFIERRVMFGEVPLHLTSVRTAYLHNTSSNHAYFQVLDPHPFPGLSVMPVHGVVPVGGNAELRIHLTPNAVLKFDTKIQVAIRGWKTLELRMGGTVIPPCVDIDMSTFNLGGVYVGSSLTTTFNLINKTHTETKVEMDLTRYSDFRLKFLNNQTAEDITYQMMNPGMYTVTLGDMDKVACQLIFTPTEVASYDFTIPVEINATDAPSPASTPYPPTPAPSNKNTIQHIINPRPVKVSIATPRRRVVATALRQPLQMSHTRLEFAMPTGFTELGIQSAAAQKKGTLFVNNSDKTVKWSIDVRQANEFLERGVFKFLHSSGMPYLNYGENGCIEGSLEPGETQTVGVIFCPSKAGVYQATVPIILNDEFEKPYLHLELYGEYKSPKVWFDPLAIVLSPVPLDTAVSQEFMIFAIDYNKATVLDVELPEVECEDGSKLSPLHVTFHDGSATIPATVVPEDDREEPQPTTLACSVTFKSPKPVSFCQQLTFVDTFGNRYSIPVTATADNTLLTSYPFLAAHRNDHQIVCEQGRHLIRARRRANTAKGHTLKGRRTSSKESMHVGEAVYMPVDSPPSMSRASTTATSSNFEISSSSYEETSQSVTETTTDLTPRDGAVNKLASFSADRNSQGQDITSRSLGSALFPDEDTDEGMFYSEVLLSVQRWFSSQGWPGGPFPIIIPYSLRSGVARNQKAIGKSGGSWDAANLRKEIKTIYDMVGHLAGRPVPGIPINAPLPSDPTERVLQIHWQHSTLLTFMRSQGASVASIKPEYLMEPGDYKYWKQLQKQLEQEREGKDTQEKSSSPKTQKDEMLEDQLFEAVSKRAWTDILLQILKTLVLSRITPRQFKNMAAPDKSLKLPTINPDPQSSNVYSVGERIVLAWMNHCYEHYRTKIWENCQKGGVPPSRWIVNFEFDLLDGLVLAACVGAYVPFLVKTHLQDMYTYPTTGEQCLHNALRLVNAIRYIGIDYDIQAIDITDPNPICLMLLCIHLYQKLPHYIPKNTIDFPGSLHSTVMRQISLSNPSARPLVYHALLAGRDARDFVLPKGDVVTIPPRSSLNLVVNFTSRFLRPAEALLVLVGRRQGSAVGSTLVFAFNTLIDNISPKATIKCESPCYELERIILDVQNPFSEGGDFRIVLVEAKGNMMLNSTTGSTELIKPKRKKAKKIRSRTDHGQARPETPPSPEEEEPVKTTLKDTDKENVNPSTMMSAFYCPAPSVYLDANGSGTVELHFLPFHTGKRQCSIIFINESVGEFLYSVEAIAELPLPSPLPFKPSNHSVRISSAAAAGRGRGMFGGDDQVIYWRCEANQELNETLSIPITNSVRERALIVAAQQHMSEFELQRRRVTGTLASGAVTAKTIDMLSTGPSPVRQPQPMGPEGTLFKVELDSPYFSAPTVLRMPNPLYKKPKTAAEEPEIFKKMERSPAGLHGNAGVVLDDGLVELPVHFDPQTPGHYPCRVVLKSQDDIRVYHIECTVSPEGNNAELQFTAPVHQAVTQDIPIINQTNHDWPLEAVIDGMGFCGPPTLLAKAYQTSYYPLMFRPQYEAKVQGSLTLTNKTDGTEHQFQLSGVAQRPLAIDHVVIESQCKQSTSRTFQVPNVTRKKLTYRIESDLPFLCGAKAVTVLPGQTATYTMSVTPLRRGRFKGMLAFVAGRNLVTEVDSDGDDVAGSDDESDEFYGYTVWYSVDIHVKPAPPERVLELKCACQKTAVLAIGVNNPTTRDIVLEVTVDGHGLKGPNQLKLEEGEKDTYELIYSPAVIGQSKGSLIFYHDLVGEFWYELHLTAETPGPTTLPHMECELGRWTRQHITLNNPTDETLELIPTISNTNNFTLERDNERPITLRPHSHLSIPLHFMPSTLGHGDHEAKITFHSEQLGEWVYIASGTGLLPHPQDPVSVHTPAGSNTTLIIPFRNPLDHAVVVDVILTDKDQQMEKIFLSREINEDQSPFCLLLKNKNRIRVGPKSTLDIPVSFAPEEMRMYEALCVVIVRKEDGGSWHYLVPEQYQGTALPRTRSGGIHEIRWLYPIHGIPESMPVKDSQAAIIECQARSRIEERMEVTLSGVAPSSAGPQRGIRTRAITPKHEQPKVPEGIVVGEGNVVAEEFTYDLQFQDSDDKDNLKHSVALSLIRQHRDKTSGLVVLIFNVVFAPYRTMSHDVHLCVRGSTGGIWKFPIRFIATEPVPDDDITIEAVGLEKQSVVGFRLTSQEKHPTTYNAYFVAGSDTEFTVSPQTGELLPLGTNGSLISVGFTPGLYGKVYQGKLVIQTANMQWTYNVKGVLPEYTPPRGASSRPMAGPHPDPRRRGERMNYIRENLKLNTTAVSSPVKGAPVLPKRKY